ncbi:MAG: hypothetical protein K8S27_12120 [Candidatus Omnitrophica bacterium]|nr:hypothetical protein [Candidatus Omnitrophota bacterium]
MKFFIRCAVIFCLFFSACDSPFSETHSNDLLQVTIDIPRGWVALELEEDIARQSMAFQDGMGGLMVINLLQAKDVHEKYYIDQVMNPDIVDEGVIEVLRREIIWFIFRTGSLLNIAYYVADQEGRVFSVIGTAPADIFAIYREDWDIAIKTLKKIKKNRRNTQSR